MKNDQKNPWEALSTDSEFVYLNRDSWPCKPNQYWANMFNPAYVCPSRNELIAQDLPCVGGPMFQFPAGSVYLDSHSFGSCCYDNFCGACEVAGIRSYDHTNHYFVVIKTENLSTDPWSRGFFAHLRIIPLQVLAAQGIISNVTFEQFTKEGKLGSLLHDFYEEETKRLESLEDSIGYPPSLDWLDPETRASVRSDWIPGYGIGVRTHGNGYIDIFSRPVLEPQSK
jgi:hypothetical protein